MKLKKLENTSNQDVCINHKNGAKTTLPPGATLSDVNVINLEEIRGQTKSVVDLGEINEDKGRTRLDD